MAVVNNSGNNYTLYYNVIEYFKTIMVNHPSIGSVSIGDTFQFDDIEYPYYPIGNVLVTGATFTGNETQYEIQLTIADKVKLKSNDSSGSRNEMTVPFLGVDDTHDIWANTLAIMNDLTAYTQRSQTAFLIDDDIECTPFKDQFDNGLAGWVSNFTLKTHNDRNMCLFDLNPQGTTTTTTAGPTTTTTTTTAGPTTTTTTSTTTTTTAGPTTTTTTSAGGYYSWSTKFNGNEQYPEVCVEPTVTLYTSVPTLSAGVQIWKNSGLTIPFVGGPGGDANYIYFVSLNQVWSNNIAGQLVMLTQNGVIC